MTGFAALACSPHRIPIRRPRVRQVGLRGEAIASNGVVLSSCPYHMARAPRGLPGSLGLGLGGGGDPLFDIKEVSSEIQAIFGLYRQLYFYYNQWHFVTLGQLGQFIEGPFRQKP